MKILWVLVNCNTKQEAERIGAAALKRRLISCFDVFKREVTRYLWPPKSGKIASGKGCLLVLETLPKHVAKLDILIRNIHSDTLPFIGSIAIENVHPKYLAWMKQEL